MASTTPSTPLREDQVAALRDYTACDVSDALVKLKVPGGGFIPDLHLYSQPSGPDAPVTIAPASTMLFVPKGTGLDSPAANIPKDAHWADLTPPDTVVVIRQPDGQTNAVCGGIMAVRMKLRQAKAIVVAGRARDLEELRGTGLPVSRFRSDSTPTAAAAAAAACWSSDCPTSLAHVCARRVGGRKIRGVPYKVQACCRCECRQVHVQFS